MKGIAIKQTSIWRGGHVLSSHMISIQKMPPVLRKIKWASSKDLDRLVALWKGITVYLQSKRAKVPAGQQDQSRGWCQRCEWGRVVPDLTTLCPSNLGLHKPFSGPLHRTDLGNVQSRGFCPNSPALPQLPGSNSHQSTGRSFNPTQPCFQRSIGGI